jgi:patatin-related protein
VERTVEEIRVALALNGGVSLAVWMGGCAVELDSARRADGAEEDLGYDGVAPPPDRTQTRSVYHALCAAFGRKLVLDIMSGASAGGVNGALLGAAMKAGRRLHPEFVRGSWIRLGDFSRLLQETSEEEPRSLMQGELFHADLVRAFRTLLGEEAGHDEEALDSKEQAMCAPPAAQEKLEPLIAKLDVTMTDVVGAERVFRDEWGGTLVAREHRARFRFREEDHYDAPRLAAAARTSASFPLAFEPWRVSGEAAKLAGLGECGRTYGVDGGLLDNAPIRAAIDLIPGQRADRPVRRFVCYLNADPPLPTLEEDGEEPELREPGLDDVVGYVVNLPRVAPFVEQLEAVRDASRRADVARAIQESLLEMRLESLTATAAALFPAYRQRRTALSFDELLDEPAEAAQAAARLEGAGLLLPWIPPSLDPPAGPGEWAWGVRPAQRILHLLLDLLRPRIEAAPQGTGEQEALLAVRRAIDGQIEELNRLHRQMTANAEIRAPARSLAGGGGSAEEIVERLSRFAEPYRDRLRGRRRRLRCLRLADAAAGFPHQSAGDRGRPALARLRGRHRNGAAAALRAADPGGADAAPGPQPDRAGPKAGPAAGQADRRRARPLRRLLPPLLAGQRLHVGTARRRGADRADADRRGQGRSARSGGGDDRGGRPARRRFRGGGLAG